jgi:4-carboxymuconolactone decarboxylase
MSDVDAARPRLTPLPADEWGEAEHAAFGALLGIPGEKVPRAGSGHAHDPVKFDIIGMLVRHPDMARMFLQFNGYLLRRGELPVRLRELAILRVAVVRRSAFFWAEHVKVATDAGVHRDDIARLSRGTTEFEDIDRLVLDASDELLANGRAREATWRQLVDRLGMHQAMELVFVVGTYAMLAMAFETWGLLPPPGSAALPGPP